MPDRIDELIEEEKRQAAMPRSARRRAIQAEYERYAGLRDYAKHPPHKGDNTERGLRLREAIKRTALAERRRSLTWTRPWNKRRMRRLRKDQKAFREPGTKDPGPKPKPPVKMTAPKLGRVARW